MEIENETALVKYLDEIRKSLNTIENVQVVAWKGLENFIFKGPINIDLLDRSTIFDATIEEFDPHIGIIVKESQQPNQTKSGYTQFVPITAIAKIWKKR